MKPTPFFLLCALVLIAPHVGENTAKVHALLLIIAALVAWSFE